MAQQGAACLSVVPRFYAPAMTSYEATHPTVLVQVAGRHAQIDEQLAPTIQALWECGFDTFTCTNTTLNLKTHVHSRPVGERPYVELEPTDHPLAVEQRTGITVDRVREIAAAVLHSSSSPQR